jgi:hypothetical protein
LRCRSIPSRLTNKFLDGFIQTPRLVLHHQEENKDGGYQVEVHLLLYLKKVLTVLHRLQHIQSLLVKKLIDNEEAKILRAKISSKIK